MALKESEIRVLALLGLVNLILWAFFGLFWSLLLVFTFLIYAYNFGRQHSRHSRNTRHEIAENLLAEVESDVTLYQEKLHDGYPEYQDLPFTGLPKGQFTLRSPMPLLSEVTKRLSFNTSTVTPFQTKKTWHNNRELGTQYLSKGSPVAYWRKRNNFSLLNPALQRPSTVKIASPDVTMNRTFTLSNSPLKSQTTPDHVNPCSRDTVLSALKESRKRSFVVDDEEDLELLLRPTKRRSTKPVNDEVDSMHESSPLLNKPLFGGLKRAALHDIKEASADENSNKRSKFTGHSLSSEAGQDQRKKESAMQKRKNIGAESAHDTSKEDSEESKSKKAKNVAPADDQEDLRSTTAEGEDAHMTVDSSACDESNDDQATDTGMKDSQLKKSSTKKSSSPETEVVDMAQQSSTVVKSGHRQEKDNDTQPPIRKDTSSSRGQKRFTVPRFLSKEDSRRRAVPVYCASNEESDMPQRRTVTRKINQEQIKIDRKLAWERVKKFLDDDEEEEEEDEDAGTSKSGTTAVSSTTTTTCTCSSLFKIPAGHAVSSTGTVTTTTTQSLITPALATGFPQQTVGSQGGLATSEAPASSTLQGNTAVTQSQASRGSLLQSQQTLASRLLTNLSSVSGVSTNVTKALPTAPTKQDHFNTTTSTSGIASSSNLSTTGLQSNIPLTSTLTVPGIGGFQLPSVSSFGNSTITQPAKTSGQLTSLSGQVNKNAPLSGFRFGANVPQSATGSSVSTTQESTQKVGFSFPTVSSSGVSGSSTGPTASVQSGVNFAAPGGTQNSFSFNKTVSQGNPGSGSVNNSTSTFALATSTSQNPVAFGSNTSTVVQSPFGSLTKTTQQTSSTAGASSSGKFGQSTNAAQSPFGLVKQNKGTFGSTQGIFGGTSGGAFGAAVNKSGSTQSPFSQSTFGAKSNQNASQGAFGANPSQNAFGAQQSQPASQNTFGSQVTQSSPFTFGSQLNKSATQSSSGTQATQIAFGAQLNKPATQSTFGNQTTKIAFGAQLNQPATQGTFGTQATKIAFGAQLNQPATQNSSGTEPAQIAFGAQLNQPATQSTFGSQTTKIAFGARLNQPATQGTFGTQATKIAFGAQLNQPAAQNSSGTQPTQIAFGAQLNQPATQSAFGAPTCTNQASKSSFSFAASQSTFGAAPSQNAAVPSSGFNFSSPASNSATGGFNFNASGNSTSGFQFGTVAAPSSPAPTGGFNFAAGSSGVGGSPFASPTPAPAFGTPGTPQGANTLSTAKLRARLAARRRGKK